MKKEYNEFDPQVDDVEEKELIWLRERAGNFTGSENSKLMSCDRKVSKMPWGAPEKITGFGTSASAYIYGRAMERRTGFLSHNARAFNLDYGNDNEPLLIAEVEKKGVITEIQKCDFTLSDQVEHLGATPDGKALYDSKRIAIEMKSCVSWDGHYKRMSQVMDEKHGDFWQWITEMHVLNVDRLAFIVAYPMEYKYFETTFIEQSKIHENALIDRVRIANDAIENFNNDKAFIIEPYILLAIEKFKLNS